MPRKELLKIYRIGTPVPRLLDYGFCDQNRVYLGQKTYPTRQKYYDQKADFKNYRKVLK